MIYLWLLFVSLLNFNNIRNRNEERLSKHFLLSPSPFLVASYIRYAWNRRDRRPTDAPLSLSLEIFAFFEGGRARATRADYNVRSCGQNALSLSFSIPRTYERGFDYNVKPRLSPQKSRRVSARELCQSVEYARGVAGKGERVISRDKKHMTGINNASLAG